MAIVRSLSIRLLLALLAVAAALLLGEMALRARHALKAGTAEPPGFIEPDARLGWKANAFRVFGDVDAARPKLLVIGDSFTQAVNVPAGKTYAALLAAALDVEVFSYGGGGFGTLQELMVLEDVIDTIDPDIVLLQFCSNDFINNSVELESKSSINNNNGLVRPYLSSSGAIVYRSAFFESAFLSGLLQRSRLFRSLAARLYVRPAESVELAVARDPGHRGFQESVAVTRILLRRFKDRVGSGRALLVFTAEGARTRVATVPAQYQAYMGVAEETLVRVLGALQIAFVAGVADAVADREASGAVVKDFDGAHWNELGHRIVAQELQRAAAFRRLRTPEENPA